MPNLPTANPTVAECREKSEAASPPQLPAHPQQQSQALARAFAGFSEAAASLERSYESLRGEVERLRRELESSHRERERAEEQARRSRALAELSSVLAHEVRNPLGSMELFAGLLLDAGLSRQCREWVLHLQAGLRTLGATVNNVLDFHAHRACTCAPTDLGELLDEVRQFVAPQAGLRRVEIVLRNQLRGVVAEADRNRMFQLLLNLALNALRFMPGGGWMELAGLRAGVNQEAVLRVSDSGPGIRAEHLERVFEPGFSTHPGSPGLGLAVSRRIVSQHGGTITAHSRPGRGAVLEVRIPLGPDAASVEAAAAAARPAAGGPGLLGEATGEVA